MDPMEIEMPRIQRAFSRFASLALVAGLAASLLLLGPAACRKGGAATQRSIILEGASDVQTGESKDKFGGNQTSYKLKAMYPAAAEIDEVTKRLQADGWQPIKEDPLRPDKENSLVTGWAHFDDSAGPQPESFHRWTGVWENPKHDLMEVTFTYHYPKNGVMNMQDLLVNTIYWPAAKVAEVKKTVVEPPSGQQDGGQPPAGQPGAPGGKSPAETKY